MVDYFIRFVVVYVMINKLGWIVVDKIFNDFVFNFGFFDKIYYDEGWKFENYFFKYL